MTGGPSRKAAAVNHRARILHGFDVMENLLRPPCHLFYFAFWLPRFEHAGGKKEATDMED